MYALQQAVHEKYIGPVSLWSLQDDKNQSDLLLLSICQLLTKTDQQVIQNYSIPTGFISDCSFLYKLKQYFPPSIVDYVTKDKH